MTLLLVFLYNYFTCFWMMVFPGFPTGFWYQIEMVAEIISFADLFAILIFPRFFPSAWQIMFLLHTEQDSMFVKMMRGIASLPTSIVLSGIFRQRPAVLRSFWVASTRLLKLCRFRNFNDYFDPNIISRNSKIAWAVNLLTNISHFMMVMHFVFCIWLLPGRFEDGYGWQKAAGYFDYPNVPHWQMYLDSMVYCISNMGGMGFGN